MATGRKNALGTKGAKPGRYLFLTHGPMTEVTATLDGQQIGSFICPPGRRYAVRRAGFFVGTRATTGTTLLTIEKVATGVSVGSGDNLTGAADNAGVGVDDNGSLAADNSFVDHPIDDEDGSGGVNIVIPGDRFFLETSGTLTGLANVYAYMELQEIEPFAGA